MLSSSKVQQLQPQQPRVPQVSLKSLQSGQAKDMWLDVGPPKEKHETNPLHGGIRVSTTF